MATFSFRGRDIPLVMGIDDLELDDAELLEIDLGIDLRDVLKQPMSRMLKAFVLMSVRREFPDVRPDDPDIRRLKLGPLIAALGEASTQAVEDLKAEGVPAVEAEAIVERVPGVVLSPTNAGS